MTWLKINKVIDGTLGTYKTLFVGKIHRMNLPKTKECIS